MVAIVTEMWYPPFKAEEVANKFLEVMQTYPVDKSIAKPLVPGVIAASKKGIHSIAIGICKDGKIKEAIELQSKRMLMLGSIKGVSYSIHVYMELAEAMSTLGMTPPEF